MGHSARNACPKTILSSARVFFVTTKTSMARRLLQSERNALMSALAQFPQLPEALALSSVLSETRSQRIGIASLAPHEERSILCTL
jgi:hypothetical protein